MKNITLEMIKLYKPNKTDWLGFSFSNINELTYHHIIKQENKGVTSIDNGALLTKRSHNYLHLIELLDIDTYNQLNNMLKKINEGGHNTTKRQLEIIELLFLKFEYEYASKLIKGKYTLTKKRNMATNLRKRNQAIDKHK